MQILGMDLNVDTGFVGIIILIFVVVGGAAAIWMTLDSQYPKVRIDVRDRGTRKARNFRVLMTAIFKDDLIGMLMGRFTYMGDLSKLTFYMAPNGKRIYDAYMRYDYLFGFRDVEKSCLEMKPKILLDWKLDVINMKAQLDLDKGLLCPLTFKLTEHVINEVEVMNGKAIGTNYIQVMRRAEDVISKNQPVMAVLISAIPIFIMGAMFAVMLYVAYLGLGQSTQSIMDSTAKIVEAAARINGSG